MNLTSIEKHPVKLELLPHLIDRVAREEPQKTWAVRPRVSSDLSHGFEDITYAAAANAINRAAWFFKEHLGKPQPGTFPVVSYTGTADLRYCLLPIALVKCGYQILLLSDMSSVDMREYLLKAADCKLFSCTASSSNDPVLARLNLQPIVVPELDTLLAAQYVRSYPYHNTTEQSLNDPLMKLHTSGTSSVTGKAKLVSYTLGTVCTSQLQECVPILDGHENLGVKDRKVTRFYTAFRISHAGGVFGALRFMYQGVAIVLGGDNPLSLDTLQHVLNNARIDAAAFPPILIEAIAKRPDLVCQLSKLKHINYAGGRLSEAAGNEVAKHTSLYSRYGSTENTIPVSHATDPEDWQYCHFNPEYSCISFRRHPPDKPNSNLFEAVIIRPADPLIRQMQPIFWNFPNETEWSMEDLFEPHPTKANHWKYIGRRDDMIIVGNATNIMPTFFEQEILERDPRVKKAVLYGNGEAHLAVLIELTTPVEDGEQMEQAKEELWPLMEACNQKMSRATQVARHAVVIAAKDRPLPRAGKGDVQRKLAQAMYAKELVEAFKIK